MDEVINVNKLMEIITEAKYQDESGQISNFARGWNKCIENLQIMLIREYGAKLIEKGE